MKECVSVSEEDLVALGRSRVEVRGPQQAVRSFQDPELEAAYAAAWVEWSGAGDEDVWAVGASDGLADSAR